MTHGILALAEDDDVAYAGDALEGVFDVDVEVVGDEVVGVAIGRREMKPAAKTKLLFALVMVMPVLLTVAGRRPCAEATRFCTSTAAMSRS